MELNVILNYSMLQLKKLKPEVLELQNAELKTRLKVP
jgi:hypothetical protein